MRRGAVSVDIARIDSSATLGDSWLHRASPITKLVAFGLLLTAVVVSWNVLVIAFVALLLVAVTVSTRVPRTMAFSLALYPALFALIFAFSAASGLMTGATIVLKALTAALAAVVLMLTTPYPQVFAPLQRVLPTIVGDALLMTYRSLFLLLEKLSNLVTAIRLRSGFSSRQPVRAARATTRALGGLLLYSIDLAQRDHDIMRVRGYEGRLRVTLPRSDNRARDTALVVVAVAVAATSIIWRVNAAVLNPYSWLPPLAGLLLLATAFVSTWRRR